MLNVRFAFVVALAASWTGLAQAEKITVRITNLQKKHGVYLTPVVFSTHDGSWAQFMLGEPASEGVERIAEDGTTAPIIAEATMSGVVCESMATTGGPIAPGESRELTFDVDALDPKTQYLNYISMVIPSNDAFIANEDPMDIALFDDDGNLIERVGAHAEVVLGSEVWDAGTEVNDEVPEHTAFLAQSMPDTGVVENGVVGEHPGFMGSKKMGGGPKGNILKAYPQGDFTRRHAQIAMIEVFKP